MAKLFEITELSHELALVKDQLAREEKQLFALMESYHQGVKPTGYEALVAKIIQLLKEIAHLNQAISIKYLSLAADAESDYEEENLLSTASKFAQSAEEAENKVKSYAFHGD